jgi:hypothetical protein
MCRIFYTLVEYPAVIDATPDENARQSFAKDRGLWS